MGEHLCDGENGGGGGADSRADKEVEPRDLLTHGVWEMLQREESWFPPGVLT